MTIQSFPAHAALPLSEQERQALPQIQWKAPCAPDYRFLESTNTLGTWHIGHPQSHGRSQEPVELGYQLPMEDGEGYPEVMAVLTQNTVEDECWWRAMAKTRKQEIGFVHDQEYAKVFVERALRQPPGKPARQILQDAGFSFQHSFDRHEGDKVEMWKKEDDKRGVFSVALSDHWLTLTHEKRHATHWTNLLSLRLGERGQGGLIPRFHCPQVPDPLAAAADMAVYFSQHWKPSPKAEKAPVARRARP